ncbi:PAS domain-containing sensor histidine kinase [candidate division KSB1 bacterium]
MKFVFKDLKIKYKVFLSFFILVFFVVLILLFSIHRLEKDAVLTEVNDRITELSKILAYSSVNAILSEDFLELQGLIESIKVNENVLEVSIFNKDGMILSSTNAESIGNTINKDVLQEILSSAENYLHEGFINSDEPYLESVSPVYSIEDVLGYASIKVSLTRVYNELNKTRNIVIAIGILAILTAFLISFYLSKIITNPIIRLSSLAKEYGKGNFSVYPEIDSKDEVGELSSEFNQMAKNIVILDEKLIHEERLSALGKTASAIAHELKTPLTSLKAYAEKLSEKLDNKDFLNNFRDIILSEVTRLNNLVNDLLRFSRKESLNIEKAAVNDIIKQVLSILHEKIDKKNITIQNSNENSIEIYCDREKMIQVFINIINNAVEAVKAGGTVTITQRLTNNGTDKIIIDIIDTGKGIPPDNFDKLFEPFFSTKSKGTGLGLAICNKIVKMHNGAINVESKEGEGSHFSIILPIKYEE